MDDCYSVSRLIKNNHLDDEDWEEKVVKYAWTQQQSKLFSKVVKILDLDRLARLANADKLHEPVHRRVVIDKSVERLRKALAAISWEPKLTQWLHHLLMDSLPPLFMAIYIDIMQTLKAKVPALTDRILFGRPGSINQDLVSYVLRNPWQPQVAYKNRKLPGAPFIVVVPSAPVYDSKPNSRMQQWFTLLTTMAQILPIQVPVTGSIKSQPLESVTEHMTFVTRAKLQELRQEAPDRPIILVGFNAGAALALQVGMVENVYCIVTLGFAYNTMNGVRGTPDDHILDIAAPVLFVVGQNAAKTSPEEIEGLREKMQTSTAMVVVGSADDALRIGKTKRKIEGVTQSMVDNMVADEIAAFCKTCLETPPKFKTFTPQTMINISQNSTSIPTNQVGRKRKSECEDPNRVPKKLGRPKLERPLDIRNVPPVKKEMKSKLISLKQPIGEVLDAAVNSILPLGRDQPQIKHEEIIPKRDLGVQVLETKKLSPLPIVKTESGVTNLEIKPTSSTNQILGSSITFQSGPSKPKTIKLLPSNQFIQLKPQTGSCMTTGQGTKIVTLKGPPQSIKSTLITGTKNATTLGPGSKIYTLKSGLTGQQQLVPLEKSGHFSGTSSTGQINFSPTKFTIMKQSGHTSDSSTLSAESSPSNSDYSILDLPVLFADHEGNIQSQDTSGSASQPSAPKPMLTQKIQSHQSVVSSSVSSATGIQHTFQPRPTQYIIQTKPTIQSNVQGKDIKTLTTTSFQSGKNIVISSQGIKTTAKPSNIVVLSKNAVRPISSIVKTSGTGQPMTQVKYAKLVMTPQGTNAPKIINTTGAGHQPGTLTAGKKIEILNSSIIRSSSTATDSSGNKYHPIIINVDPSKAHSFKTFIKKPDGTSQGQIVQIGPRPMINTSVASHVGGNIILKPSVPQMIKQQVGPGMTTVGVKPKPTILSRGNLTVKRVVSVLPPKPQENQDSNN